MKKEGSKRIAVIGGDLRQVYLADDLSKKGYEVTGYGLCGSNDSVCSCSSLAEALEGTEVIAAPVPFLRGGQIPGVEKHPQLVPEKILENASFGSLLFGGAISEDFIEEARQRGIRCIDYLKDERVAMENTVAVAEGVLAECIRRSPRNLTKSRCLVLGYGRCGSTLVSYLKKLSCHVTVLERRRDAAARACLVADCVVGEKELAAALRQAEWIINTIPAVILDECLLESISSDTTIFDLASAPGCAEEEAAKRAQIKIVRLPGLPGRYAPQSSARILAERILREYGNL